MAETVAGGRYKVGDAYVNAEGKPLKAQEPSKPASTPASTTYPYADLLAKGGFKTWEDVSKAKDADLIALDGIGQTRLAEIRAYKG